MSKLPYHGRRHLEEIEKGNWTHPIPLGTLRRDVPQSCFPHSLKKDSMQPYREIKIFKAAIFVLLSVFNILLKTDVLIFCRKFSEISSNV